METQEVGLQSSKDGNSFSHPLHKRHGSFRAGEVTPPNLVASKTGSCSDNRDEAHGNIALGTAEEQSLIDESFDDQVESIGLVENVVDVNQWSDSGTIATLSAPVTKKVFADDIFRVQQGQSQEPLLFSTTKKYTVVLVQDVPLVLVNDWDTVGAITEATALYGIQYGDRTPSLASIWASLLWPVLEEVAVKIDLEETLALLRILKTVCTKACIRLASANTNKIDFHMSVMGSMIRLGSTKESELYFAVTEMHRMKIFQGRLIKVIVDVEVPNLKFVIEYVDDAMEDERRLRYSVLTPSHLRHVNDCGLYFRYESCVFAGLSLTLPRS